MKGNDNDNQQSNSNNNTDRETKEQEGDYIDGSDDDIVEFTDPDGENNSRARSDTAVAEQGDDTDAQPLPTSN